jgi:hypothetical protein
MKYSQELLGGAGCGEKTVAVGNWRVWQDVRGSLMASDMSESLKFGVKFTPKNCRVTRTVTDLHGFACVVVRADPVPGETQHPRFVEHTNTKPRTKLKWTFFLGTLV